MRTLKSMLVGLMAIAMLGLTVAQHEEDIHLGYVDSTLAVIEPHELAEPPYTIEYTLEELLPGIYGVDVGWDFHTEEGASYPQLRRVTVQQVFISRGLFGVIEGEDDPIFGEGLPGTWTLIYDPNNPDAVHQHIIFASNILPTRDNPLIFRFRLINGIAFDGTPLNDSVEYTLEFVPEPASLLALSAGLIGLLRRRRQEVKT